MHVLGKDVLGRITTKVMRNDVQAKLKLPHADVGFTVKLPLNKPLDDNFLQDFSVRFVDDEGQRGKMFGLSANVARNKKVLTLSTVATCGDVTCGACRPKLREEG